MTAQETLYHYWGYSSFRGIQEEIIDSICSGHDTLGLMPTGGGKSITFQVPALMKPGVCIVVTPLISLMTDQVMQLRKKAILAAAVHSGLSHNEVLRILDNCILGHTKLLYISPERISSDLFITKYTHMAVSFLVVDEAHCISQWGHDFRPAYMNISRLRELKPQLPILALTATATEKVIIDICESLQFSNGNVIRMSFARKNLAYIVEQSMNRDADLVRYLLHNDGSAIVYVRSRRATTDIANMLCENGIAATTYHAGMDHVHRNEHFAMWHSDQVRVMVATNAFGMGIDKPDVRIVIHVDCPGSIEAYFQEAGRAGRDGLPAQAILLHSRHDDAQLIRHSTTKFPPKNDVRNVYEHLAYFFQVAMGSGHDTTHLFDIDAFCYAYHFYPPTVSASLALLQQAGYIKYDEDPDGKGRVKFIIRRDDLYHLDALPKDEDKVMRALLRNYTGLFADHVYISEAYIASVLDMTEDKVYRILIHLSKQKIIHYIPQRKKPRLTYLCDRLELDELRFPPEIYEDRLKVQAEHVNAMIQYANNDEECRARQLLTYFSEQSKCHCGICDVCVRHNRTLTKKNNAEAVNALLLLLADHQWHSMKEINTLQYSNSTLADALRALAAEDKIAIQGNTIRLA